jgi:hypothetical protein
MQRQSRRERPAFSLNARIGTFAVLDRVSGFSCPYEPGAFDWPQMVVVQKAEPARDVERSTPRAERLRDAMTLPSTSATTKPLVPAADALGPPPISSESSGNICARCASILLNRFAACAARGALRSRRPLRRIGDPRDAIAHFPRLDQVVPVVRIGGGVACALGL